MINTFLLTMQAKIALMQSQISSLTTTIKELQNKIDILTNELDKFKKNGYIISNQTDENYINSFEPAIQSINEPDTQFVIINNTDNNFTDDETGSESEYDSEY